MYTQLQIIEMIIDCIKEARHRMLKHKEEGDFKEYKLAEGDFVYLEYCLIIETEKLGDTGLGTIVA